MTHVLRLACSLALVFSIACGDDDGGSDAGADAATDTRASDTATDTPVADTATDTVMADVIGDFLRAAAATTAETCECDFAEEAHASPAECIAFNAADIDDVCFRAAYDATVAAGFGTDMDAFLRCDTAARDILVPCLETAACDEAASDACIDAFSASTERCGLSEGAGDAFGTANAACFEAMIVGEASGCPDTEATTTMVGAAVFSGSNLLQGNDSEPSSGALGSCAGMGGPDVQHQWTAPSTGEFVFDTIGSNFDTVLYVLDGCEGAYLECNDDVRPELGARSRITLEATADTEYLIVVDGYDNSAAGDYVVNITGP